ncbi:MAG: class II glutamine amidotransferase [Oscillospiraceae bacterium]|nr:class II glutamine amidotransferase [Oscillospiraceae bacterium]
MCAIFGLIDYNHTLNAKQREKVLRVLSQECEERGTDATGYAYNSRGKLTVYKRPFTAHNVHLKLREDANVIMGHTRMATQGNKLDNRNNHPFPGVVNGMHFALAHNGVLHNDLTLRAQMKLPNTPIKTDSYIAVQLLEQQKTLDMKSIGEMAELVEGSFVFTILDEKNNMYFVKGDNPLALYHYEKYGFYVYASTESILDRSLTRLGILGFEHTEIDTNCGDIIKIDNTGVMERGLFDTSNLYAFDYRFLRSSYWDYPDPGEHEPQDVKQLKDFAASIGISREDIDLLLCYGYFVEEIEEMLYHPGDFEQALAEILDECAFDYCGEF